MNFDMNVQAQIQQASISVYGITGNFFDLKLTGIGKSSRRESQGSPEIPISIMLSFSGRHAGLVLDLHSYNIYDSKSRHQTLKIGQPHPYPPLSMDNKTLQYFRLDGNAQKLLGLPTKIVEQIMVMEQVFTLEMHYWELVPHPAWFLLHNEEALVFGQTLGFVKDELFQLFQRLIVVNTYEQLIQQYQQELDRHISYLRNHLRSDNAL